MPRLRVVLERKSPQSLVTFEAESFCISEGTGLTITRDEQGRVLVEVSPNWTITVDEVQP